MSELVENTRDCLKNNAKIKRTSKFSFFISGLGFTFLIAGISSINVYFFYFLLAKTLIILNVAYFTLISACANTPQYFKAWSTSNTRKEFFKKRMTLAYWWIIKLIIFSTIIFIFIRYTAGVSKKYPGLVSQYIPASGELILIIISIALSLLALYTMPYWCIARYAKIQRWDAETKLLKSEPKGLITGILVIFLLVMIIIITDISYVHIQLGLNLQYIEFLEPFGDYLLPLEITVLLLAIIVTYLDGKRQIRIRTDFVLPPPLGQVVVK